MKVFLNSGYFAEGHGHQPIERFVDGSGWIAYREVQSEEPLNGCNDRLVPGAVSRLACEQAFYRPIKVALPP